MNLANRPGKTVPAGLFVLALRWTTVISLRDRDFEPVKIAVEFQQRSGEDQLVTNGVPPCNRSDRSLVKRSGLMRFVGPRGFLTEKFVGAKIFRMSPLDVSSHSSVP